MAVQAANMRASTETLATAAQEEAGARNPWTWKMDAVFSRTRATVGAAHELMDEKTV